MDVKDDIWHDGGRPLHLHFGPQQQQNLDDIALGSLDYDQLMNYFEGLKESAA